MSRARAEKRRLSRERVLDEAMAALEEDGLDGLTMRSLADRLGVVPMALYRHVANKDDLLDGVMDRAVAHVPLPDVDRDWRSGLHELARNIRATMLEHPDLVAPITTRPSLGPSSVALGEYAFTVLLRDGFSPAAATRAVNLLITYTLGFVALEVPRVRLDPSTGSRADDRLEAAYGDLSDSPHTAAITPDPAELISGEQFEFGLACILDALDARRGVDRR